MKVKKEVYVRLNSRVRPDQLKSIKDLAKKQTLILKRKVTEGEANRSIIDYYFKNNK